MKNVLFPLTFLLLLVLAGTQALEAQVTSRQMPHSRGNNDALILELPTADDRMVGKLWTAWLKDTYKVKSQKVKKSKNEWQHLNFSIPGVSTGGKLDMYSMIRQSGSGSEVMAWIATPEGYISPELDRGRYLEAEKMMVNFALEVSKAQIEEEVEAEEDKLKGLEKELDKLRKEKEDYEKKIADAERAITEARQGIEKNLSEQKGKEREIQQQIRQIDVTKRKLKGF